MRYLPPSLFFLRAGKLWLPVPLVLLWPLLPFVAALAVAVLAAVRVKGTTVRQRVALVGLAYQSFAALRGLNIDLQNGKGRYVLAFW